MTKWKASEVFINNEHNRMMIHEDKWGGKPIADCGITLSNESKKNARLIAAAPELLEFAENMSSYLKDIIADKNHPINWRNECEILLNNCNQAITKSKGE